MAAILKDVEAQALQLSARERGELIKRLILSLEGPAGETAEAIAQAWDEEVARRLSELNAGTAELIPAEQVLAEIDAMLRRGGR